MATTSVSGPQTSAKVPSHLKIIFLIGCFALELSIVTPHPLLAAIPGLLAVLVICVGTGLGLFAGASGPRNRHPLLRCAVPWLLAGAVVANWKLDTSPEISHSSVVTETHFGRSWDYVVVQSWRPGRKTEWLLVKNALWSPHRAGFRFYRRDRVTVGVKPGALGLTWVSSLTRSDGKTP